MKKLSTIALALALAAGAASLAAPALAFAQAEQAAQPERKVSGEKAAEAIFALQTAVNANDAAGVQAALPAADAAAKTANDRYIIGQLRLKHAIDAKNDAAAIAAIEAMIASGAGTEQETIAAYQNLIALNNRTNNAAGVAAATAKLAQLQPNNPDIMIATAATQAQTNPAAALPLFMKAIEAKKAAGQPVDQTWYMNALKTAYEAKQAPQSVAIGRDLLAAYPTAENWKAVLQVYRELVRLDTPATVDLLRFARTANAMSGKPDYYELADALNDRGLPGETKAVIEDGIAKGAIASGERPFSDLLSAASGRIAEDRQSLPAVEKKALAAADGTQALNTGDAYFGYRDYAKAAALYRAALQKGGVDANLVNTRLGTALALAGQKAEAETAFKAVTGPRQDIANFWMLWLNQQAA